MSTFSRYTIGIIFLAGLVGSSAAISAEHPGYEIAPEKRTTGIGKFYMGREISLVMGHQAAACN